MTTCLETERKDKSKESGSLDLKTTQNCNPLLNFANSPLALQIIVESCKFSLSLANAR